MRFGFCLCQTMMSSQVRPPKRDSWRLGSLRRRDDPSFTMSNPRKSLAGTWREFIAPLCDRPHAQAAAAGGARRDRTDDLMLAKHALYQLSYGPNRLEPLGR